MVEVTTDPIHPGRAYDLLDCAGAGSVLLHCAHIRGDVKAGKTAGQHVELVGDLVAELEALIAGLQEKYPVGDVVILRRVGELEVGDIASVIAVSGPHREEVFAALTEGLGKIKKVKSVKKTEAMVQGLK